MDAARPKARNSEPKKPNEGTEWTGGITRTGPALPTRVISSTKGIATCTSNSQLLDSPGAKGPTDAQSAIRGGGETMTVHPPPMQLVLPSTSWQPTRESNGSGLVPSRRDAISHSISVSDELVTVNVTRLSPGPSTTSSPNENLYSSASCEAPGTAANKSQIAKVTRSKLCITRKYLAKRVFIEYPSNKLFYRPFADAITAQVAVSRLL